MSTATNTLIRQGLWSNNPALVQLLGLCPLLAVSTSVVNALGLGLATILVLAASNLFVSLIRQRVSTTIRLPAFVLIIAGFVSCAELLLQAFAYPLYLRIGIFIPLIVTNCTVLGRAVSFAARNPALPSLIDGVMMGLGFSAVLVLMGFIRELLASGTVFANMELLLPFAANWELQILPNYPGFLLAILPPGAFILMGFILALRKWLDLKFTGAQDLRALAQSISNHE